MVFKSVCYSCLIFNILCDIYTSIYTKLSSDVTKSIKVGVSGKGEMTRMNDMWLS